MRRMTSVVPRALIVAGLLTPLLTAACSTPDAGAPPEAGGAMVFEGARLIPGEGAAPIEDAAFVVRDGRVAAVGRRGEVQVPEGAARIDLAGKTVMPAIIDAHKHFGATREEVVDQLRHMAYYGIGAAMSMGLDAGELPFQLREETIPDAARFLTAGRGITAPEPGRSEVPHWVATEEEARAAVREITANEVDLVKIWVDDRGGQYPKLSPALYSAAIDEAHRRGRRVAAHIFSLEDAKGLLRAGIDVFAHGIRDRDVDDEVTALFRERPDVYLIPNLPDRGVATDLSWLAGTVPAGDLAELQARAPRPEAADAFGIQARNLARLYEAGVPIALGTDGTTPWAAHIEMEDMVAAGMPPAAVIEAATSGGARFLRLEDMGAIAPGKSADFLVLDADPLEDITNTRRISAVYLRGTPVDRTASSWR